MSKKKSYMNLNDSVIREGVFDNLFKLLKFIPKLKNDSGVKRKISDLNNDVASLEDMMNAELKAMGSKKKVELKKYDISNIMG